MSASRHDWLCAGDRAGKLATLTFDQRDYAITLRRQLAERLGRESAARAGKALGREGALWDGILQACQREAARMERAAKRLARESSAARAAVPA